MARPIEDRAQTVVAQPASIVHARLAEMATLLTRQFNTLELPPSKIIDVLGFRHGLDIRLEVHPADGGVSLATHRGRFRFDGQARLTPRGLDQSDLDVALRLRPAGIIGRVLWWIADRAGLLEDMRNALVLGPQMAELAEALGASDAEWAAARDHAISSASNVSVTATSGMTRS